MNTKNEISLTRKILYGIMSLAVFLAAFGAGNLPPARAQEGGTATPPPSLIREYFSTRTVVLADGTSLDEDMINGPSTPPAGYELERTAVALPESNLEMAIKTLGVPAFDWSFGCSATSGAMIAGYYDRTGFTDMYTGPTNSSVIPLDSSSWPDWTDGVGDTYGQCPLTASHNGLDGRTTRGSIDDYWVSYNSTAQDPYITNGWTQHTWGDAIGDYMKTSQSAHSNIDSSTTFYTYTSSANPLTCSKMSTSYDGSILVSTRDGTYGRKLFYEAKGYMVTDCYNQKTDNNGGGFTFALFKAEIDAGRPVLINLEGHSMVGVGYNDSSNTVYIHDTWDYETHTMTWGGSYSGMPLRSVSIVNIRLIFAILSPVQGNPAYAGTYNSPSKIVVEVTKPENGLAKDKFSVAIGGRAANIVTLYEDSAKYVLEVNAPIQDVNGLYDLTVSAVTSSGTVTDTEIDAVSYAAANNVDVDLAIDRTGSMAGSKIDAAKNAAKQLVDFMQTGDMIGVVSFNTSATTDFPLTTISSSDTKTQAKAAIDAINALGFTSIAAGLQRGQEQLTTLGQADHPWAIILLSDGQENTAPWVADVLPGIVSSKTVVYTIGLGSGADEALLMDIASQTGGTYNFAPGPEQLAAIYNTIVGVVTGQQTLFSETGTAQAGVIDEKTVMVDSTISEATFSISWSNSATTIALRLLKPDGTIIDASTASSNPNIVYSSGATFAYYRVKTPTLVPGVWEMQITGGSFSSPSVDKAGNMVVGEPYLAQVTARAILTIETYFNKSSYFIGQPVGITVSLSDSHPILGANVTVSVQSPSPAAALIRDSEWIELNGDTIPDPGIAAAIKAASVQTTTSLTLYDDGAHGDGAANDGFYANQFSGTTTAGTYTFNVTASGNTSAGDAFIRQDSKAINVGQGDSTFADVPTSYWAWDWIERLYAAGITAGCRTAPLAYCPESSVTRAQMAIFLERGIRGSTYLPPAATGMVFADVPVSHWAAAWIEKLAADGITTGCGGVNYCPEDNVTRAQMAIFLLRAKHGAAYEPPPLGGTTGFADVPINHWAAAWIKQLATEAITSGCGGGNYCPDNNVTRAEMAVFLVRTFNLP